MIAIFYSVFKLYCFWAYFQKEIIDLIDIAFIFLILINIFINFEVNSKEVFKVKSFIKPHSIHIQIMNYKSRG